MRSVAARFIPDARFTSAVGGCLLVAAASVWLPHAVSGGFVLIALGYALCAFSVSKRARDAVRVAGSSAVQLDHIFYALLLIFAAWGVTRCLVNLIQGESLSASGVGHFAAFFIPFWLARCISPRAAQWSNRAIFFGIAAIALMYAIVAIGGPRSGRIFAPYSVYVGNDAISLSLLLAAGSAAAAIQMVRGLVATEAKQRWVWVVVAAVTAVFLFSVQMSRAAFAVYFIAVVVGGLAACRGLRQRIGVLAAFGLLLAVAILTSSKFQQRAFKAFDEVKNALTLYEVRTSQGQRLALNSVTLHVVQARPVVGFGLGSWRTEFAKRVPPQWMQAIGHHSSPHNEYMHFAAQLGWVGGVLYGLVCLTLVATGIDSVRRGHSLWLLVFSITLLVGSATNVMVWDFRFWNPFCALLALALAQRARLLP